MWFLFFFKLDCQKWIPPNLIKGMSLRRCWLKVWIVCQSRFLFCCISIFKKKALFKCVCRSKSVGLYAQRSCFVFMIFVKNFLKFNFTSFIPSVNWTSSDMWDENNTTVEILKMVYGKLKNENANTFNESTKSL